MSKLTCKLWSQESPMNLDCIRHDCQISFEISFEGLFFTLQCVLLYPTALTTTTSRLSVQTQRCGHFSATCFKLISLGAYPHLRNVFSDYTLSDGNQMFLFVKSQIYWVQMVFRYSRSTPEHYQITLFRTFSEITTFPRVFRWKTDSDILARAKSDGYQFTSQSIFR